MLLLWYLVCIFTIYHAFGLRTQSIYSLSHSSCIYMYAFPVLAVSFLMFYVYCFQFSTQLNEIELCLPVSHLSCSPYWASKIQMSIKICNHYLLLLQLYLKYDYLKYARLCSTNGIIFSWTNHPFYLSILYY